MPLLHATWYQHTHNICMILLVINPWLISYHSWDQFFKTIFLSFFTIFSRLVIKGLMSLLPCHVLLSTCWTMLLLQINPPSLFLPISLYHKHIHFQRRTIRFLQEHKGMCILHTIVDGGASYKLCACDAWTTFHTSYHSFHS